jgi:hypothetical protein
MNKTNFADNELHLGRVKMTFAYRIGASLRMDGYKLIRINTFLIRGMKIRYNFFY